MTKLGGIESSGTFGGYTLVDSLIGRLPQDLATAISVALQDESAEFVPMYYYGYQLVNGMNYVFICKRIRKQISKVVSDFVRIVINIPAEVEGYKKAKLIQQEVADETILSEEASDVFKEAIAGLIGAEHKALIEVGKQIVKGMNYHFICQSRANYPEAEAYLTRIVINEFANNVSIVSIDKIGE